MLSNQLIKNNTVALTELAKNSYDADANWVQIRIGNMKNFGKKRLAESRKPFVEIEDDGDGMSFETIRDSWMNPAAPDKYLRRLGRKARTRKRRIIQGEKGIGRYATFQMGKKVEVYTRERIGKNRGGKEISLVTDLSVFTEELISRKKSTSQQEPIFFDQLKSKYAIRDDPKRIRKGSITIEGAVESRKNHGTLIRITELNYKWTLARVRSIRKVLSRLQSPFRKKDFAVSIVLEGKEVSPIEDRSLEEVFEEAILEMEGLVDENGVCDYILKGTRGSKRGKGKIDLVDFLKQDAVAENRSHFFDDDFNRVHNPNCGPFSFRFYVFDIKSWADRDPLKAFVRDHRTYIYRDDIRIYPYGDRDIDWIRLDVYRGTIRAAAYLSNDQLIGYVNITSEGNPSLRDKTNREGLLEQGTAYEDLRLLTLSALNLLHIEYRMTTDRPRRKSKRRKTRVSELHLLSKKVQKKMANLDRHLQEKNDFDGKKLLKRLRDDYFREKAIYGRQLGIVEDLAGVGIAVDATSHDMMITLGTAREKVSGIDRTLRQANPDLTKLKDDVSDLKDQMDFIGDLMIGVQPLFRSARRKSMRLRASKIINTVKRYYAAPLRRIKAKVNIKEIGEPLVVTSSEGVLLQLFINLMDNSIYWLRVSKTRDPIIGVLIDGESGSVTFADNGPGVEKKHVDYIFEPFFSTKGIEGRGLGLYIARQLADRYEYDLYYVEKKSDRILPGANFRIDFEEQEE